MKPAAAAAPPRRRERNPEDTKKRLLDAAEAEFAQRGFFGARLRDIATQARSKQALIHHHFGDKAGLYRAVIDRAVLDTAMGSWDLLARGGAVIEMITGFVDLLVRFHEDHANLLAILASEAQRGDSVFVDVMRERTGPLFVAVEALVVSWQDEGSVRADLPAHEIIVATLSMTLFPYQEAALVSALLPGVPKPKAAEKTAAVIAILTGGVVSRG